MKTLLENQSNKHILTNAFTLSPVPGSIVHAGGTPVLVDVDAENLTLSLADLKIKHKQTGAKLLLLSYMRGKIPADLEDLLEFCRENDVTMIEDCAHTLGCSW